jgi:hypothetical protein
LGTFALTLPALLFAVIIAFSSFTIPQIVVDTTLSNNNGYKAYGSLSDFNFAAAGRKLKKALLRTGDATAIL